MEKNAQNCVAHFSQSIETYVKINLVGMFNANRFQCQSEKWADMGTFNTEWTGWILKYTFQELQKLNPCSD